MEFHPNGAAIGSANLDACVKLYDLRTGSLYQHYAAHEGPVNMIKFHPKGNFMLTASGDSTMKVIRDSTTLYRGKLFPFLSTMMRNVV